MKKCTCYPDSVTVVDFFASMGVPDGIIPGDQVVLTLLAPEWDPTQEPKLFYGKFIGVTKKSNGKFLFLVEPKTNTIQIGDVIARDKPEKPIKVITDCPFHNCALNSGRGTCHSTNTIQCKSIPSQFEPR